MSDLLLMAVMFCAFTLVVYGAHRCVRYLRQRGHGARLDALYDATVRAQGRFFRGASSVLRAGRSGGYPSAAAPPPADQDNTKQD